MSQYKWLLSVKIFNFFSSENAKIQTAESQWSK